MQDRCTRDSNRRALATVKPNGRSIDAETLVCCDSGPGPDDRLCPAAPRCRGARGVLAVRGRGDRATDGRELSLGRHDDSLQGHAGQQRLHSLRKRRAAPAASDQSSLRPGDPAHSRAIECRARAAVALRGRRETGSRHETEELDALLHLLAGWSCLSSAFGGRLLSGGSGGVIFGVVLIVGGFAMSVTARMLASVNGPDTALWRRPAHP